MKFLKEIAALSLLLCSFSAHANMASGKITEINMGAEGDYVRIKLSGDYQDPAGCTSTGGFGGKDFYVLELTTPEHNRFLSLVIAAHMQEKEISMWISGCTTNQYWGENRPQPKDIYLN